MKSSPSFFRNQDKQARIYQLSDKEGGISFFNYIKHSDIVCFDEKIGLDFKNKNDPDYFVYCGDAVDHGPYDLAIIRHLSDFKQRYPDRVILIAGNREITKIRFPIELDPLLIRERLLHTTSPRWLKTPTTPIEYVIADMKRHYLSVDPEDNDAIKHYIDSLSISECQLIYLHWMLEMTMGCKDTFESRRAELAHISKHAVSDDDVLQSMLKESMPNGLIAKYLMLTQVAAIIPNTRIIAMHGGLNKHNIGRLPTMAEHQLPIADVTSWIEEYNHWYQQQIEDWLSLKKTNLTEPAFTKLDDISLPLLNKPRSIMVSTVLNEKGEYQQISPAVSDYLTNNNIHAVLIGHQQCGDFPVMQRTNNSVIINSDTGHDPCGHSVVSAIEITASTSYTDIRISGRLADDSQVFAQLAISSSQQIKGDPYIGRVLPDHRLVQCRLADGDYRLVYMQSGNLPVHTTCSTNELDSYSLPE